MLTEVSPSTFKGSVEARDKAPLAQHVEQEPLVDGFIVEYEHPHSTNRPISGSTVTSRFDDRIMLPVRGTNGRRTDESIVRSAPTLGFRRWPPPAPRHSR